MSGTQTWTKITCQLGCCSGQVNVQVVEQSHMSWLNVCPKKSMVVWKRIPYDCLWFDAGAVPDGERQRQGRAESISTKRIFGLGENYWYTLAIDETIVAHFQACYP